jgi:FkbM family methyltransferase
MRRATDIDSQHTSGQDLPRLSTSNSSTNKNACSQIWVTKPLLKSLLNTSLHLPGTNRSKRIENHRGFLTQSSKTNYLLTMQILIKTKELRGILVRNLYLRGRRQELTKLFQARVLRLVIEKSGALEWYVRDSSKVLMKIDAGHNFQFLLENEMVTDAMPLAKYLEWQTGELAVDIGANRGYVTVVLARKFHEVIAFEPDPQNKRSLEETLTLNAISNVMTVGAALSLATTGQVLRVSTSHGHHTLEAAHLSKAVDSAQVQTYRFDEFAESRDIKSIDLIKIDVEGHELSVLKGFGKMLNPRMVKKIVFEHSLPLFKVQGKNEYEVIDFLNAAGFEVQTLDGAGISRDQISSIQQADLVAVPSSSSLQKSK